MSSKFNDKLDNLGTFFKGLKEDDVILLQNDKDTSYNEEIASYLYLWSYCMPLMHALIN